MAIESRKLNKKNCYLGQKGLKREGVEIKWTEEMILEYAKCRDDIVYFCKTYIKIVNIDDGLIPFDMYPFQEELVNNINDNRFSISLCSRQIGKSITTVAYLLHFILFNEHKQVGVIANKGTTARKILGKLKLAYTNVPSWLQSGVVEWNKGNIELENGCKIEASSTSGDAARGDSLAALFIDECAFISENLWEEFYASVYPTISSSKTAKVIMVSTANGMNHYHKLWNDAVNGRSTFSPFEVNWESVPGRDEAWRQETIANTSEEKFAQEHENQFLGSSDTLIPSTYLLSMVGNNPIKQQDKNYNVYEEVKEGHKYFVSVDCGQGVGLDHSVVNVFDITTYPFKQVAVFRDNHISPLFLPQIILNIATKYNKAWTLIENNDIGSQIVADFNFDLEYENIVSIRTQNEKAKMRLGMRTTKKSKAIGCSVFKELVRDQKLIIQDQATINECSTFVKKANSYEAETGKNDDIVMTIVNFAYATTTVQFEDIYNLGVAKSLVNSNKRDIEEDVLPPPMISDGVTDYSNSSGEFELYDPRDADMAGF